MPLRGITVGVLAGGLGTRIASVLGDTPKVLAPINGRPFLDHLLDRLNEARADGVVLCLGHLADKVTDHLRSHPAPLPVSCVREPMPLGTGGALRLARPELTGDVVLVLNGDTWIEAPWADFRSRHETSGAAITILCTAVPDIARFGSVECDPDGRVQRFAEKDPNRVGPGIVSAGAYLISSAALDALQASGAVSFERDFLPSLPARSIMAYVARDRTFVDIGTPDSLAGAPAYFPKAHA